MNDRLDLSRLDRETRETATEQGDRRGQHEI